MPGSPGFGRTCRLEERTDVGLVVWIVVFPFVGLAIFGVIGWDIATHSSTWTLRDWFFHVPWLAFIGIGIMVGLPGTAWRELQRRRSLKGDVSRSSGENR